MPDDFDLDWRGDDILNALRPAWGRSNEVLGRKFQMEITSNKWAWPTGQSPRDIVDKGQLRDSYTPIPGQDGQTLTYEHTWDTEYAMAVHEGARLRNGTTLPARPWTREPLKNGALEKAFGIEAKRELRKLP